MVPDEPEDLAARLIVDTEPKQREAMVRQAEQLLRETAQRNNGSVEEVQNAYLLLVGIQSWRGRRQPAASLLVMTALSKCSPEDLSRAALLFFSSGDFVTAEKLLTAARRRALQAVLHEQPDQPDALHLQGWLLLDLGDVRRAIDILTNISQQRPIDADVQYLLGQAYARDLQTKLAEKHLQRHRLLRDTKVRINTLERQAGLHPNDLEVRETLANLYESLGLTEQACQ
jgi:predicted Zn-dependent protease